MFLGDARRISSSIRDSIGRNFEDLAENPPSCFCKIFEISAIGIPNRAEIVEIMILAEIEFLNFRLPVLICLSIPVLWTEVKACSTANEIFFQNTKKEISKIRAKK